MNEIWRPVKGFGNHYEVSNLGRVRSLPHTVLSVNEKKGYSFAYEHEGRVLKPKTENGYKVVTLINGDRSTKRNIGVHRLVAFAFVPGYFEGAQVNHINEIRNDNRPENLEWVTPRENINHGGHNKRQSITKSRRVVQYDMDGRVVRSYYGLSEASRQTGIARENIGKCCNHAKGYVSAGGFLWAFDGEELIIRKQNHGERAVAQYTKDGQFVAQYESIREAAKATGANAAVISRVIDTKYRAKKYLWKSV